MEKWFIASKKADFYKIAKQYGITPVTARLIRNRDVEEKDIKQYLYPDPSDFFDPFLMKDMRKAVDFLKKKIEEKRRIRIIGDYDIDGVCATYILLTGLREIGAIVDYDIPERIKDGYGINRSLIERAYKEHTEIIITCDNGISAREEISYAGELGIDVLVTDHHEIPYEIIDNQKKYMLPKAIGIINPKQEDCEYPFKELCGAVVAYKLIIALFEEWNINKKEQILSELLPFAAIATVGDVMDLKGENRSIVKLGLEGIAKTNNAGLLALIKACNLDKEHVEAYHIGFVIGPCMNAGGRLETAKRTLELLLCRNHIEAATLAESLKNLNEERKRLTQEGIDKAEQYITDNNLQDKKVLVVYLEDCHESLAGIIAGRIREIYYKPVIVLTKAEQGLKGSGRSIEAYSMYEELCKVSQLLTKFGGHKMAAGLSLKEENLNEFCQTLNDNASLTEEDFYEKILIDVAMPLEYVSEQQIKELSFLEPFGKGNEKPQFAQKDLKILQARKIGKNKNICKMLVQSPNSNLKMEALYFGDITVFEQFLSDKFGQDQVERMYLSKENTIKLSAVYYPSINEYGGQKTLQIIIKNYC